jgi:hypothetical protein
MVFAEEVALFWTRNTYSDYTGYFTNFLVDEDLRDNLKLK